MFCSLTLTMGPHGLRLRLTLQLMALSNGRHENITVSVQPAGILQLMLTLAAPKYVTKCVF